MIPLNAKVDFQRMALDIKRAGLALETVSHRCGRHRSWMGHVVRGEVQGIEFHTALQLIKIHKQVCGGDAHNKIMGAKQ